MKKNPSVVTIILFLFFALITTVLFSCNNEITTYTVYFNSQEGTPIDLVRVSKGSRIAEPPEPTRENYDFDGWYTDPSFAMAWKFNQDKVTYDLTLYAKWVERRYSISFNGNGHTDGEVPSIQEEQQGQTITLPGSEILHRTGYEFVCWNTQVDGSGTDYAADYEFVVDANIIFYAKWSARQYTVTFDKQDGNGGSDSITVTYDSAMPSATAPTRTGTAFDGYFDQEEGCGSQYYSSTMASLKNWNKADASTLYAKWTNTYTVTFNSQDGSYIDALEDVREGSTIQVPTPPTRDGYAFANWYTEASFETVWSFDTPITQDTTLYAKWIKTYTVTFSSQGSILSTVEDVREGSIINTPTPPTRDGYDFGGWYKESSFEELWAFDTDTVGADTTLYAKWIKTYTVTFNSQGSVISTLEKVPEGSTINAPTPPTRDGYNFVNWYGEATFDTVWDFDTPITKDTTLYAKWVKRLWVSFNGNGYTGDGVPSPQELLQGQTTMLPEALHRTGYEFVCWNTQADGSGTDYAADSEFVVEANITFYAKWNAQQYSVAFDKQGGTGGSDSITVTYDSAMPSAAAPTKTGVTFDGYFDQVGGGGSQYYSSTMTSLKSWNKTDASTLYAKWIYTVTFDTQDGTEICPVKVLEGSKLTEPPVPTKDGYIFDAWYKDSSFDELWGFDADTVEADTVLYAKWLIAKQRLRQMILDGEDVTGVDTSGIIDMSELFKNVTNFNQDISGWDVSNVTNMSSMFYGARTFNQDISSWDVSSVTDMSSMFYGARAFNQDISSWDVSSVTDMNYMFASASAFNHNLSAWNVSNVTNMGCMFYGADSFNGDISKWDVHKVTDMNYMFCSATSFNSDLSDWNVSNVTHMGCMFFAAWAFNQDISGWDVGKVTSMSSMFSLSYAFNQDLSAWDVSSVKYMSSMFQDASSFNGDISKWDVSNVTDMSYMFDGAIAFNQNLSAWDVSKVTSMSYMFCNASSFNSDLSVWDVSNVKYMGNMFNFASSFNGNISTWDVSNVTNMSYMFYNARSFNKDLSAWDANKVTDMSWMFCGATVFNSDLSDWNVSNVKKMHYMFSGASSFNRDISKWNVSKVTDMGYIFYNASSFNQNLSDWDVSSVRSRYNFSGGTCPLISAYHPVTSWNND